MRWEIFSITKSIINGECEAKGIVDDMGENVVFFYGGCKPQALKPATVCIVMWFVKLRRWEGRIICSFKYYQ
jgi:hypothetical protein